MSHNIKPTSLKEPLQKNPKDLNKRAIVTEKLGFTLPKTPAPKKKK